MDKQFSDKSQPDKFRDTARDAECDESEAAFEDKLRRIAKAKPSRDAEQK